MSEQSSSSSPALRDELGRIVLGSPRLSNGRTPDSNPLAVIKISELAQLYSEEALGCLVEIMRDDSFAPTARGAAAKEILDRAWGKPGIAETPQDANGNGGKAPGFTIDDIRQIVRNAAEKSREIQAMSGGNAPEKKDEAQQSIDRFTDRLKSMRQEVLPPIGLDRASDQSEPEIIVQPDGSQR